MERRLELAAVATTAVAVAPVVGIVAKAALAAWHAGSGSARRLSALGLAAKIGLASSLFAAGGATGAVVTVYEAKHESEPTVLAPAPPKDHPPRTRVATPPPAKAAPAPTETAPPASIDPPPPALPEAVSHAGARATSPLASAMSDEQRLLFTAREAVARQAYGAAITTLREHETRFPDGKLTEERELLFVQALTGAGQGDAARARALAFEQQFPRSIFLPAVKAASSSATGPSGP